MKTSELEGNALDWAIAKAEGVPWRDMRSSGGDYNGNWWWEEKHYSTSWNLAGPIIERELIGFDWIGSEWTARKSIPRLGANEENFQYIDTRFVYYGETPLIAAMRCYVASKLGDEVEIPSEF